MLVNTESFFWDVCNVPHLRGGKSLAGGRPVVRIVKQKSSENCRYYFDLFKTKNKGLVYPNCGCDIDWITGQWSGIQTQVMVTAYQLRLYNIFTEGAVLHCVNSIFYPQIEGNHSECMTKCKEGAGETVSLLWNRDEVTRLNISVRTCTLVHTWPGTTALENSLFSWTSSLGVVSNLSAMLFNVSRDSTWTKTKRGHRNHTHCIVYKAAHERRWGRGVSMNP